MTQKRQRQVEQWQYIYYKQAAVIKELQCKIKLLTALKDSAAATTAEEIDVKIDCNIKLIINIITVCDYVDNVLTRTDAVNKKVHALRYRDNRTIADVAIKAKQSVDTINNTLSAITNDIDSAAA